MSRTCPSGHPSDTADYCSVCGLKMGAARKVVPTTACPACGAVMLPDDKFCERCGTDLSVSPPVVPTHDPPG